MPTEGDRTMPALVVPDFGSVRLDEVPVPETGPDGVLVRVRYSGVSAGTEMWAASGDWLGFGPPPFVTGYQACGEVVEVGDEVADVEIGATVAVFANGAHAAYVRAQPPYVHRLPNADPALMRRSSMFVPPSVGCNALNHADVRAGDTVLIVGQGLIGQATAQLARLRGAYVLASDVAQSRLDVSRRCCADEVIDASQTPGWRQVRELFPDGVDVVIESTGLAALLKDALSAVRAGGRFVFGGYYPGDVAYPFWIPHTKEVRAFYPCGVGSPSLRDGVIRLIASEHVLIDPLVTHEVAWPDIEREYAVLFSKDRRIINGMVIDWGGAA